MKNPLSANEFKIMELFWQEERPLSRPEIIELTPDKTWNPNSIHLILNNMIEKGVIAVSGLTRCGRGYGRTYAPTMTQLEYAAYQAQEATPGMSLKDRLVGIVGTLLDKSEEDPAAAVSALEKLLKERKKAAQG